MNFHVVTLFPEMFDSYLGESILARAIREKNIKVNFVNPRKFVTGKYRKVWPDGNISLQIDDRPYGGGPGMVMMADPMVKAVESVVKRVSKTRLIKEMVGFKIINFVPSAEKFTTESAKKIVNTGKKSGYTDIIFICGRYEGIDARMSEILIKLYGKKVYTEFSIGDYVLTGGELPAMVLIDTISRQVPGVLGNFDSREEERISSPKVYTRPEIIEYKTKTKTGKDKILKSKVPTVLLSGDHKKIEEWKKEVCKV
jgi:tRNA (guanine37-N1)-methyltransferase